MVQAAVCSGPAMVMLALARLVVTAMLAEVLARCEAVGNEHKNLVKISHVVLEISGHTDT